MAALPPNLKGINSFLKLGKEYDKRDPTVAYFCRMFAIQKGIKLDSKSPDCKGFLIGLMDQLEQEKEALVANGDESMSNDIVAQAHIETKTINLFTSADTEDRKGIFNKNIIKSFYSASLLFEVLTQFGEQNEECQVMQKYSKWKATYLHKCSQTGETPIPGPEGSGFEDDLGGIIDDMSNLPKPSNNPEYPTNVAPANQYELPPNPSNSIYQELPSIPGSSTQVDTFSPPSQIPTQPASQFDASKIDLEQVKKLCKFALSAIEYEDIDSTVTNLTNALNLLTGN